MIAPGRPPSLATFSSAFRFSRLPNALCSSSSSRLLSFPRDAASSSRQRLQLLQPGAHAGAASQQQQQRQRSNSGGGLCAHRSAVTSTVQQHRHSYSPPEARPHSHSHHREPPRDDGSIKIIMLLGLSLTLLLLPWMSRHPEFLVIPVLLAVTPVVGNGVRPVLREVAAGFLTTLKLAGLAAWYDVTHDAPAGQHGGSSSSSSLGAGGLHRRQQQYRTRDFQHPQQQQQPAPLGPHSPWPNPARMPDNWTPPAAAPAAAGAGVASAASAASASVGDADVDWAVAGPPDPHASDPGSRQHLQQVLAADLQAQAELTGRLAAAAAPGNASSSGRPRRTAGVPAGSPGASRRSPSASPVSSLDGGDSQHGRDPRTLSREAKQQLYQQGGGHHPHPGSDSMDQQ